MSISEKADDAINRIWGAVAAIRGLKIARSMSRNGQKLIAVRPSA
jgi:hypothetical protein